MSSYNKSYYEMHKEERKAATKAWKESNIDKYREYQKAYREAHKEEINTRSGVYQKSDVNCIGKRKSSIRVKSWRYLKKYGTKIKDYEIHHCCTYTEPYKFVYCSKEIHRLIHAYLRQHNIDADSNHYEQIKHLLDDTVVLYGLE